MATLNRAAAALTAGRGLLMIAILLLAAAAGPALAGSMTWRARAVPQRLLVGVHPTVNTSQVVAFKARTGASIPKAIAGGRVLVIDFPEGADMQAMYTQAAAIPGVDFVEQDTMVYPTLIPNDPRYAQQYHWPLIRAPEAWNVTTGSANVVIAFVDTGCDLDHPDLVGRIFTNPGEVPGNGVDDDHNGFVDDVHGWDFYNGTSDPNPEPDGVDDDSNGEPDDQVSHGTLTAGIACATGNNGWGVAGMNWGARILPIQVFPDDGGSSVSRVVEGIDYAVAMGADILNLSLGGDYAQSFTPAIANAYTHGVLVVAAAGNNGRELRNVQSSWSSPVCNDGTIGVDNNVFGVGATDQSDRIGSFSNFDGSTPRQFVECCAPGQAIYGPAYYAPAFPHLSSYFYSNTGTSFAAPIVSGLAGLVLAIHPGYTPDQVRAAVQAGCDNIDALNPGFEGKLGAGRVNAARVLGVPLPPRPPRDVTAADTTGDEGGSITVAWLTSPDDGAGADSVTEYIVRRRRGATGSFSELGRVPAGGTQFVDDTVTDGVDYYYKVLATDGTLNSDAISFGPVQASNDNPPPKVQGLRAADVPNDNGGSIILNWNAYADPPADFAHFSIYRSTGEFANLLGMTPIATVSNVGARSFVDNQVTDGAEYYYAVGAVDQFGNEDKSVRSVGPVQSFANGPISLAAGLHFFGSPIEPANPDAAAFFGIPPDQLSLARWQAADSLYTYYSPANRINVGLGKGYWLRLDGPLSFVPTGAPAPAGDFGINLGPGWRALGNPYFGAIDLAGVTVTYQGTTMDLASADAANVMRRVAWRYSRADNSYKLLAPGLGLGPTRINALEGFWVLVAKDCRLTLPRPTSATAGVVTQQAPAAPDGWVARLAVRGSGSTDTDNFFGISSALAGISPMACPPPVGDGARLYFLDEGRPDARLKGRFSAVAAHNLRWDFVVEGPSAGGDVELWCPDVTSIERGWSVTVDDPAAGKHADLRSGGRYRFTMRPAEEPRRLVLRLTQSAGPLTLTSLTAQQTRAGGAQVAFTLSAAATCSVRVMNIAGRTVRLIEQGTLRPAGLNAVLWDGRSDLGPLVPAGVYLVTVEAAGEDGSKVKAMGSLTVAR